MSKEAKGKQTSDAKALEKTEKKKTPYKIVVKTGKEPSKIQFFPNKTEAETTYKTLVAQLKKGRIALQSLQGNTYATINGWITTVHPEDKDAK